MKLRSALFLYIILVQFKWISCAESSVGAKPITHSITKSQYFANLMRWCGRPQTFPDCKKLMHINNKPWHFNGTFHFLCEDVPGFPTMGCNYYMAIHTNNDEMVWNDYCKKHLEKNGKFANHCKEFVQLMVTESAPWIKEKLPEPCIYSASGSACDMEMGSLCKKDTYLCQTVRSLFTKDVYTALATTSSMCATTTHKQKIVKEYCSGMQKAVADTPKWMEHYCFPYRTANELCYSEWPVSCSIFKTVCTTKLRKDCEPLRAQEKFCEEIKTNIGTQAAYEKYCVKTQGKESKRYCQGVIADLDAHPEKFTMICTESCKKENKLCDYCQNFLNLIQGNFGLSATINSFSIRHTRIKKFCTFYSKSPGCSQILREFVLWSLEFGTSKDIPEIVQRLAKLCENGPDAGCKTGVINVRDGKQGTIFVKIHSELCANYTKACNNIGLAMQDDLDSITVGCEVPNWSDFLSCGKMYNICFERRYKNCEVLTEKFHSNYDMIKFADASPKDKKDNLITYCKFYEKSKHGSPACQTFIERVTLLQATDQNTIIPDICDDANNLELGKELVDRIVQSDGFTGELVKLRCAPWSAWKKHTQRFCALLHSSCADKVYGGCSILHRLECEAPEAKNLKECRSIMKNFCGKSHRKGDPVYEKCKDITNMVLKNKAADKEMTNMCGSKNSQEISACKSVLDITQNSGKLRDLLKLACPDKKKMKAALCQDIQRRCERSKSRDCLGVQDRLHDINFDENICRADSNECEKSVKWHCKPKKNEQNCKNLFTKMNKDVALTMYKLCMENIKQTVICDFAAQKLSTDGTLHHAFLQYCDQYETIKHKACAKLYNLCKKQHADGSGGCDKLTEKYELQIALSQVHGADANKTFEHLNSVCASDKKDGCKKYLTNNKTSDGLLLDGIQLLCSDKAKRTTCQKVLETLDKEKSKASLLHKFGLICDSNNIDLQMCEELSTFCKTNKNIPICKEIIGIGSRMQDLNINNDPSKFPGILKKYCDGKSADPEMCEMIKSRILASPEILISHLSTFCKSSAQHCQLFTQEAITQNRTNIIALYKAHCQKSATLDQCKIIQKHCEMSMLKECKETRGRVCFSIETIDKCVVAIVKQCSYDEHSRTRAQVELCGSLVKHATDSTQKISELQSMCEGNGTACVGVIVGALDSDTGYSVFENWCPKKAFNLRQCKLFRQHCNLRNDEPNCKAINALFAVFDPKVCKGNDTKVCSKTISQYCETTTPTSDEKAKCAQLFEIMEVGDLTRLRDKCSATAVQKTCDRISMTLGELGGIKTVFEQWCTNSEELETHQCEEIKKHCLKYESEGCAYVMKRYSSGKRNWAIAGMIAGGIIVLLGILAWVLLGIRRVKRYDDKVQREWEKDQKRNRKEEKKMEKLATKIMKKMKKKGKNNDQSDSVSKAEQSEKKCREHSESVSRAEKAESSEVSGASSIRNP